MEFYFLDSRFRGNDNKEPSSTGFASVSRPLDVQRKVSCLIRTKCSKIAHPDGRKTSDSLPFP